ncbi:hypothetical protein PV327_006736 [Microctonus hyperodae]|uniref:NudC domain-containing protein 1 n=1 Tax=Microctonus hyperodae TaxID=165561 RepID=A0AA39F4W7_MICHY|nr:hypothetical protein PV327_006736 [Microctonus hyperodae]
MTKIIDLRPKKDFLNLKFEKYQFSSDIITITDEKNLSKNVLRQEPSQGQESWLEARLFAFHNHLFKNPFDSSCWFCDENYEVWRLRKDGTLHNVHSFIACQAPTMYNPTIAFASNDVVILTRGDNNLEMLTTVNSGEKKSYLLEEIEPGVLLDARYIENKSKIIIAMCCIIVVNGKKHSQIVILSYIIKYNNNGIDNLECFQKQHLTVKGSIEYVFIEPNGDYINVLSQDVAKFTYDSLKQIKDEEKKLSSNDSEIKIPKYSWSQDEESLTVWIKIPKKFGDTKANINIKSTGLLISVKDEILIQGELQYRIDHETAVWKYEKETLKLELMKYESGQMWNELIKGDTDGEWLPNETLAAEIHSRLSHLCTDQQQVNDGSSQPAIGFNSEQLEECDLQGKENTLQRINLISHSTTHLVMLGLHNRILFTHKLQSSQVLCIRHDHDGCVWQSVEESPDEWKMIHMSTYPGFGYVEASKTNKKFCISPPDCSYVAIIEHARHGFLYEKPATSATIAKQKIIDLGPDSSHIMGAVATKEYLVIITKNKLFQLKGIR